jgi:hypothetical protein
MEASARWIRWWKNLLHPHSISGGFLVSWLNDMHLRDLDDSQAIEATCMKCLHTWLQSPIQLLLKVDHRDVMLAEVAREIKCPRPHCKHSGARLSLVRNEDTSGFVGGMP